MTPSIPLLRLPEGWPKTILAMKHHPTTKANWQFACRMAITGNITEQQYYGAWLIYAAQRSKEMPRC